MVDSTEVEIPERIENELAKSVQDEDYNLNWAKEKYREKLAEYKERKGNGTSEEALEDGALRVIKSNVLTENRTTGEVEEVEIIAIGHGGVRQWNDDDSGQFDVLIGFGLVNPPGSKPLGIGAFVNKETDGVDPYRLRNLFRPGNELTGTYSVNQYNADVMKSNLYLGNSTEQTRVEKRSDEESISIEKRINLMRKHTEKAEIVDLPQYESVDVPYGSDIKRIEGQVVGITNTDNATKYTIADDSVLDRSDEAPENVFDDRSNVPGLTVWLQDEEMLEYGEDSYIELYGRIGVMNSGQYCMNAYGVLNSPLDEDRHVAMPLSVDNEPSSASNDVIEEQDLSDL